MTNSSSLARRPAMQDSSQTWRPADTRLPELRKQLETKLTEPPTDKVVMAAQQDADIARRPGLPTSISYRLGGWGIGFGVMGDAWAA